MSERDDEYLWSGEGPASDELVKLEKLLAGDKLRDPLRARRRRPLVLAAALAVLTAAAAFAVIRDAWPSTAWTAAVLPGVSDEDIEGAVFTFQLVDEEPPDGWQAAVEQRIREIASPNGIRFEGRRVLVDLARGYPPLEEALSRRGDFAIKEVVESSPLMRALYTRVSQGDARAAELGVTAEIDGWDHDESGQRYSDWYLKAASREALAAYLASAAAADPRLVPDAGHQIALEATQDYSTGEPTGWRTYYLDRVAWLTNADIANAYVYWNSDTNRPEVLVEYTEEGGRRFADLTGRIIGRKLAIMLDGQVSSAPVVQDRITGGRTSITMGGGNSQEVQYAAQALVDVLRASQRPMPVALELINLKIRSDELSDAQLQLARGLMALVFGLVVFAAVFAAERRSPALDPEVGPVRGRSRRRSLPWIRLAVSAAGVAAALLLERIPIPGDIDWDSIGSRPISMFALGIMPALSAFIAVELAALIVPRWRALRRGGPSARARLGSATAVLTFLFAAVQAWFIADFLLSFPPLAHLSRPMLVSSLTGGALLMTLLALVVSRYGLGNGFAVLLLAGHGALAHGIGHALAGGDASPHLILPFLAAVAATAVATSWILRHRVRGPSPASSVRLPTAGVVPLAVVPSLLALFALSWPEVAGRIGMWWQEGVARPGAGVLVELGFLLAAGALLSWLFSRPVARLGIATASGARSRGFLIAVAISLAYLAAIALLGRWSAGVLGHLGLSLAAVAFATAIVMDLVAEWRALARRDDLVPIWPLHQVQRVDLVTAALARNGIDVHTRGLYFRLLLHFFGPFVPVLLYVPRDQAEEARAIIRAQIEPK
ncbi:MAG TPA: hypothetical protein VFU21_25040 [Kofleriaceae bacterium]|nr:hypothetical protein [Kofleriaceae bacterium]